MSAPAGPRTTWLASYPKSGNTWIRALVSSALRGPDGDAGWVGSYQPGASVTLHAGLGLAGARLSRRQLAPLRRLAGELLPRSEDRPLLRKVHDAFLPDADGLPLATVRGVERAVYVVRDPRDVAVSYAHHFGIDHTAAVEVMARGNELGRLLAGDAAAGEADLDDVDAYVLPSWSEHVRSWCDQDRMPVLVIRYEDLHDRPAEILAEVLDLLEVSRTPAQVDEAVEACDFTRLALAEVVQGFAEAPAPDRVFFRRGVAGGWRDDLDPALARRIEHDHGAVMRRFGYPAATAAREGLPA